ncbi:hypothetical protein F2Q69_00017600 [Brassica cretica]|uniref:peroxidase n=1 Tax=Brassica cretica TaxID=69181 RepID=A0A8S9QTD1_BRACR|nr:hypothetical protein F2Q69_00017600 [Brassica cretica]
MGALILGCLLLQASNSNAQLRPDFYFGTCRQVFDIIGNVIVDELGSDPRIAASLLRLHFHDCFVNGCDASILLDNSTSFRTEKDAAPNANSARGFDVIDKMKDEIELACPRTVSCADILTIASQISVLLSGGPWWPVPLGRRDSLRAFFDLANTALPSPFFTLDQLKKSFSDVGLNRPSDLVALSGKGLIQSDQELFSTPRADTIPLVEQYSNNRFVFFQAFAEAMIRMGNLKPLTGTQGEIRQNCRVVNSRIRSVENEDHGVVSSI